MPQVVARIVAQRMKGLKEFRVVLPIDRKVPPHFDKCQVAFSAMPLKNELLHTFGRQGHLDSSKRCSEDDAGLRWYFNRKLASAAKIKFLELFKGRVLKERGRNDFLSFDPKRQMQRLDVRKECE